MEQKNDTTISDDDVPYKDPRCQVFAGNVKVLYRGKVLKSWKTRHCILTNDGSLWTFKNEKTEKLAEKYPVFVKGMKIYNSTKKQHCIKIERYPKPFLFQQSAHFEKINWLNLLEEVGGIFCSHSEIPWDSCSDINSEVLSISTKDVLKWDRNDVKQWMLYTFFGHDFSVEYEKCFSKTSGKELISKFSSSEDLKRIGIHEPKHQENILRNIEHLRVFRKFNYGEYIVKKKIEDMNPLLLRNESCDCMNPLLLRNESCDWKLVSHALTDPNMMCATYLNVDTNNKSFQKLFMIENKDEEQEGEEDNTDMKKYPGDSSGDEEITNLSEEERSRERFRAPIKILVTEFNNMCLGRTKPVDIFSPVVDRFPKIHKKDCENFFFTTSLQIGPWILEWNETSLCIPRKLGNRLAFVMADIETNMVTRNKSLDEIVSCIAKVACQWNIGNEYSGYGRDYQKCMANISQGYHFYDRIVNPGLHFSQLSERYQKFLITLQFVILRGSKRIRLLSKDVLDHQIIPFISEFDVVVAWKDLDEFGKKINYSIPKSEHHHLGKKNSFEFVEDILVSLGMKFPIEPNSFLYRMKEKGFEEGMVFIPSEKFMEKFLLDDEKEIVFTTHDQLDKFVRRMWEIDEIGFAIDFKEDKRFLRLFDRAFWYRHYDYEDDERFKECERGCPFRSPFRSNFQYFY